MHKIANQSNPKKKTNYIYLFIINKLFPHVLLNSVLAVSGPQRIITITLLLLNKTEAYKNLSTFLIFVHSVSLREGLGQNSKSHICNLHFPTTVTSSLLSFPLDIPPTRRNSAQLSSSCWTLSIHRGKVLPLLTSGAFRTSVILRHTLTV